MPTLKLLDFSFFLKFALQLLKQHKEDKDKNQLITDFDL